MLCHDAVTLQDRLAQTTTIPTRCEYGAQETTDDGRADVVQHALTRRRHCQCHCVSCQALAEALTATCADQHKACLSHLTAMSSLQSAHASQVCDITLPLWRDTHHTSPFSVLCIPAFTRVPHAECQQSPSRDGKRPPADVPAAATSTVSSTRRHVSVFLQVHRTDMQHAAWSIQVSFMTLSKQFHGIVKSVSWHCQSKPCNTLHFASWHWCMRLASIVVSIFGCHGMRACHHG